MTCSTACRHCITIHSTAFSEKVSKSIFIAIHTVLTLLVTFTFTVHKCILIHKTHLLLPLFPVLAQENRPSFVFIYFILHSVQMTKNTIQLSHQHVSRNMQKLHRNYEKGLIHPLICETRITYF